MNMEMWDSGKHLPILESWVEDDESLAMRVGGHLTEESLDQNLPERAMVNDEDGEPVALFGMRRFGPSFAAVHVVGNPNRNTLGDKAKIKDAYVLAEQFAKSEGVSMLYAMIAFDNVESLKMAKEMGYNTVPFVQLVKAV